MIGFSEQTAQLLVASKYQIVITGATGWIGRATVEMLSDLFRENIESHLTCYSSRQQSLKLSNGREIDVKPLEMLDDMCKMSPTIVLHYAFLTKDKVSGLSKDKYIRQNRELSERVANFVRSGNVTGVLVASSGAVYDYLRNSQRDSDAILYGRLKYEDEILFSKISVEKSIPIIIPRIFNIAGPYINKYRAYALSSIIDDVLSSRRIQLNATQPVLRSYLAVSDVIEICLHWLLDQNHPIQLVFDASGEEVVELGELAKRIRKLLNAENVDIDRPVITKHQENRYVGDGSKFRELAQYYHRELEGLDSQILTTAFYIRNNPPLGV